MASLSPTPSTGIWEGVFHYNKIFFFNVRFHKLEIEIFRYFQNINKSGHTQIKGHTVKSTALVSKDPIYVCTYVQGVLPLGCCFSHGQRKAGRCSQDPSSVCVVAVLATCRGT